VLLLGDSHANGLGGSRWAAQRDHLGGSLPELDFAFHRRLLALVARLVADDLLEGVHDVSEGGVGVCLAELAIRSGVGLLVSGPADHAELFSETPSRVVVCVAEAKVEAVRAAATDAGIPLTALGMAGGDRFVVDGLVDLPLDHVVERWQRAIPDAFAATLH